MITAVIVEGRARPRLSQCCADADDRCQDELRSGLLVELVVPDLYENFYGVTLQRRYEPPLVNQLLARPDREVLEPPTD